MTITKESQFFLASHGRRKRGDGDASPTVEKSGRRPPEIMIFQYLFTYIKILHFPTFSKYSGRNQRRN